MNKITNAQNIDVSPAIVKQMLAAGFYYELRRNKTKSNGQRTKL